MENLGPLNFLRIPLSNLWDAPNIRQRIEQADTEFGLCMLRWYCRYDAETRLTMRTQLQWALQNPTYDFQKILIRVTTSNEDILFYFSYLLHLTEHTECPTVA
ncbi:hypothetical protein [Hymenobacter cellulosilyticus]|uniref:Uncharacterized protein n=1 Tax=Hymenobacter cellulosilyticus TaxID=2932248 RepID=A0A8T9QAY7_9BACT|nr:hypothetical protein [Hymenobacter cellulosilyticus]UOQ72689.1 hypothetical protein MUN79_01455 [Hymenobacter cellulosilyticus]